GRPAPEFSLECVGGGVGRQQVHAADFRGRWLILIFYPRDFSFICPTELTALSKRIREFENRDCFLLGVSVDSLQSHIEWLNTPMKDGGLRGLQFPLASDPGGRVSSHFGVYDEEDGVSLRGLFIIDPQGIVQYQVVH